MSSEIIITVYTRDYNGACVQAGETDFFGYSPVREYLIDKDTFNDCLPVINSMRLNRIKAEIPQILDRQPDTEEQYILARCLRDLHGIARYMCYEEAMRRFNLSERIKEEPVNINIASPEPVTLPETKEDDIVQMPLYPDDEDIFIAWRLE